MVSTVRIHKFISVKTIYSLFGDAVVSHSISQAFLDKVSHQGLRSLLVLDQHIMSGSDLVSLKAIQQCNTNHSRCKDKKNEFTPVLVNNTSQWKK